MTNRALKFVPVHWAPIGQPLLRSGCRLAIRYEER